MIVEGSAVFEEEYFVRSKNIFLFAKVAGDDNPIHQDTKVAQEMGLSGPIAHGMFVYSYLLRRLDEYAALYLNGFELNEAKCRFHNPVPVDKSYKSRVEMTSRSDNEIKINAFFLDATTGEKLTHVIAKFTRL